MPVIKKKADDVPGIPAAIDPSKIPGIDTEEGMKLRKSYSRLFALGEDRIAKVEAMLKKKSSMEVVNMLQNEWHVFNDITPQTLAKQLQRFKNDVIDFKKNLKKAAKSDPAVANNILRRMTNSLDTIGTYEQLIEIQSQRLNGLLEKEKGLNGLTMDVVRKEIYLMRDLLSDLGYLQMNTGIMRKVDPKVKLQLELPEELRKFDAHVEQGRHLQRAAALALKFLNEGGEIEDATFEEMGDVSQNQ